MAPEDLNPDHAPVQSVRRALDLLDLFGFGEVGPEGLSAAALAERFGMGQGAMHNLLKTMMVCGYVSRPARGRYGPGPQLEALQRWGRGSQVAAQQVVEASVGQACSRLGENVVFCTLADGRWVSRARASADHPVQVAPRAIEPDSIYTLSTGRVLCAFASPDGRARILARHGLPGPRWDGLDGPAAFEAACAAIRRAGHVALRREDRDTVMVAVPVLGEAGALLGALGSSMPLYRCAQKRLNEVAAMLKEEAVALAMQLESI